MSVLFNKFRGADIMGVRQYIEPGDHILLIKSNQCRETKNPQAPAGQENFIGEMTVIKTKPLTPDQKQVLREGMTCNLVEISTKQGYAGNVVSYVAGVLGYDAREFQADADSENVLRDVCGEEQLISGFLVRCKAQKVATAPKNGKAAGEYTAKVFEPVPKEAYAGYGVTAPDAAYEGDWTSPLDPDLAGAPTQVA
jgi:hypothetical protein